jgi:hypothetical protein
MKMRKLKAEEIPLAAIYAADDCKGRSFGDIVSAAINNWPGVQFGWNDREDNAVIFLPVPMERQEWPFIADANPAEVLVIGNAQGSVSLEPLINDDDDDATFVEKMDGFVRDYPIEFSPERGEIKDYDRLIALARRGLVAKA